MIFDTLDYDAIRSEMLEDFYQAWLPVLQEGLSKSIAEGNLKDGRVEIARDEKGLVIGMDVYVTPIEPVSFIPLKMIALPEGVSFESSTD